MTNSLLREGRLHVLEKLISRDPVGTRQRLRDQLGIYSYQFKAAATCFNKDSACISGKVGGMKDDICICLQIAVMYTSPGSAAVAPSY